MGVFQNPDTKSLLCANYMKIKNKHNVVIEAEQCLPLETGMDWDQAQGIFPMVEMFCIVIRVVNI